jgi:hypothetical protein
MINPAAAEALARDHQHELRRSAELNRLAHQLRATRPHRFRSRAGWWLVHAGIRLALTADPTTSPRPRTVSA